MARDHLNSVVIGGGQAGLSVGYYLRQHGLPFVILDASRRVGDAWRNRWDTLRLFTPARYSGLPGMPFPGPSFTYPTKDETADYLEAYAGRFELPIRSGVTATRVSATGDRFEVMCGGDETLSAKNVVIATGAYHRPRIPPFATELDKAIVQLHSSAYRNRSQLRDGAVLIVGAGNSGAEIALDLTRHHEIFLSGPDTGEEPTRAGSIPDRLFVPLIWLVATRLTVRTRLGRKLRDRFLDPPRGIPLGRVRRKDLNAAGIKRVGRTTGVRNGSPLLDDGRSLDVSNVIWCTGYTPDFSWIGPSLLTRHGFPVQDRGIVEAIPGLYFVGLLFLYSLSSALVGGVGRDAKYIVEDIASKRGKGV